MTDILPLHSNKSLEPTKFDLLKENIQFITKETLEIQQKLGEFLVEINEQAEEGVINENFLECLRDYLNDVFSYFSRHDLGNSINSLINIKELKENNINEFNDLIPDLYYKIKNFLEYCLLISGKKVNKIINIKSDLEPFFDKVVKFYKNKSNYIENININYDKNLNGKVEIVEGYLDILLSNILINARKHGDATKLDINITEEDGFLVIKVKDNGTGINIEKVGGNINNIFRKGKTSGNGTGIGLADADKHMKEMDGEISVENMESGGAEFIIKIPLAKLTNNKK